MKSSNCLTSRSGGLLLVAAAVLTLGIQLAPAAFAGKPIDWEKKLQKGYYNLSIGNTEEAIVFFQTKVKDYPASGACHTGLGVALKRKGKMTEAKSELRRSTEVEPTYADAFYELGAMLESDKDYAGAAQSYEQYLVLKPDSNRRTVVGERIRFCKEHM